MQKSNPSRLLFISLILPLIFIYIFLLIRTAWISDDAYITFRVVENFTSGYGLVFNIGERVQAYTHPLWLFLLSAPYTIIQRIGALNPWTLLYTMTVLMSIILSVIAVCLLAFGRKRSLWAAVLGLSVLILSKAFIDYGTSGLENPLSYLIVALFLLIYFKMPQGGWSRLFLLAILASLGALTRVDLLLLFLPTLAVEIWHSSQRLKAVLATILGLLPFFLWELFSLIYYGSPFPNTAYAKLNTGIDQFSLLQQGLFYYLDSLQVDPITLLAIFSISIWAIWTRQKRAYPLLAGILLYLLYILYIGGDFMSGRFFGVTLLLAIGVLVYTSHPQPRYAVPLLTLILFIGLLSPNTPLRSPSVFAGDFRDHINEHGISDERAIYYRRMGWLAPNRDKSVPGSKYSGLKWVINEGKPITVKVVGPLGVAGFQAGPNVHIIDYNALSDSLLSRLPIQNTDQWRIGHFHRELPPGYEETLQTGTNQLQDDSLSVFYDRLALVTRGILFDGERLRTIWRLNTGQITP